MSHGSFCGSAFKSSTERPRCLGNENSLRNAYDVADFPPFSEQGAYKMPETSDFCTPLLSGLILSLCVVCAVRLFVEQSKFYSLCIISFYIFFKNENDPL